MKAHLKGKCVLTLVILVPLLMFSTLAHAFDYLTYHMEKLMFSYDTIMAEVAEDVHFSVEWTFVSKDEFDDGDEYWYNAAIQNGTKSYDVLFCFIAAEDGQKVQSVILYCDIDKDKSYLDETYMYVLDGLMRGTLLLSDNCVYQESFDKTLSDMWDGAGKAVDTDGKERFSMSEGSILSVDYVTIDDPAVDGCLEIMLYY